MFFSFYLAIGTYPLFDNNEGLYAGIAKHMLLSKDFIIPQLNGVPYIEKPPLLYWLLAISFSIFGYTAFSARLVTTTSAVLTCIMMVYFTKKIKLSQIGIIGALIFSSSIGICIIARMVYFDMLFTFLIGSTLFCWFYWYEYHEVSFLRVGYLLLGLAIMTKGLVAVVLVGGSFIIFLLMEKDFRRLYQMFDIWGIALLLAIILPWHIIIIIRHKGFAWRYFIDEHVLRYLNQREPHDYYHGSIFYYIPRIPIYLFPWSLFIPLIFWRINNISVIEKRLLCFSWCWLVIPLIFFSLSSAKANYYMIVSAPAIAILLGLKIKHLSQKFYSNVFGVWTAVILFMISLVLLWVLCSISTTVLHLDKIVKIILVISIGYCFISSIMAIALMHRQNIIIIMLACFIVPAVVLIVSYINTITDKLSTAAAGRYLVSKSINHSLYLYQDFENISALSFYVPCCFKIIDSHSNDLYYGKNISKFDELFPTKKIFLHSARKQQVYVVVPSKKLSIFYKEMHPVKFTLLKEFDRVVIVVSKAFNSNENP
ncbi:MAG: glycosyltransferase family 39 protein [Coxiellaceae bacterium]|jgi:4-amino-4-deoxy-L-arabinose transferase-like glycosyltransferase|nr:glycosyltransferase family 39 protein [Coxiellaceae bacterium]